MDNLEFETLTSLEFKEYMLTHKEKNYLVIDVRQASEYEVGHIPGAKLMPLTEVETRLFTLPSNRDLIFYCANGGRSQWAASLAGEGEVSKKTVFHYRTMAERAENSEAQSTFLSIAQAEKAHMRTLTRAIDQCPGNKMS
jgi:rhodanese-related sulfurtransferase